MIGSVWQCLIRYRSAGLARAFVLRAWQVERAIYALSDAKLLCSNLSMSDAGLLRAGGS